MRTPHVAMLAFLIGGCAAAVGGSPDRDACVETTCPSPPFDPCADWPGCAQGLCDGDLGYVWSGGRCVRLFGCHGSSPTPDATYADCVAHHAMCRNAIVFTPVPCTFRGGGTSTCSTGICTSTTGNESNLACVPTLEARGCGLSCDGYSALYCP